MSDPTPTPQDPRPPASEEPTPPASLLAALDAELSRAARLRYAAIFLAALVVTGGVSTLWATEPALPARTHAAFATIVAIGSGWLALTGYVLARRRPLYAVDRVLVTGWATIATSVLAGGTALVATARGWSLATASAVAAATTLVAAASGLHLRARQRRRRLLRRREELTER